MRKNVGQKSVDMGLRPDKNMGGWVGFFISRPHTPVTFLDKCPPPGLQLAYTCLLHCEMKDGHICSRVGLNPQHLAYQSNTLSS